MSTTAKQRKKGKGVVVGKQQQQQKQQHLSTTASDSVQTKAKTTNKEKDTTAALEMSSWNVRRQQLPVWIVLAVASGACAAIVGVFAKLTTTSLTGNLATQLSTLLGLSPDNKVVSLGLRGAFFGLNLLFNVTMWSLYTAALTKGNSTTRVSIVNVSANFMVTAAFGWAIFGESLPLLWWVGAGLLAAGNVVIGSSREGEDEGGKPAAAGGDGSSGEEGVRLMDQHQPGQGQADLIDLDDMSSSPHLATTTKDDDEDEQTRLKRAEDVDAPL